MNLSFIKKDNVVIRRIKNIFIPLILFTALNLFADDNEIVSGKTLSELSIDELLNLKVITASNIYESATEAPATVMVISREDINNRGYSDLSEILDDLPGMDVIRVNNDISFKNYMRGYRNSFGSPYLMMLDGMVWSDLYYNDSESMRACPISNIERIEVVYGPVSVIYGANAFTGVINIITKKDAISDGSEISGKASIGNYDKYIGDISYFYKKDDIKVALSARFENGDDFPETNETYEWSKSKYINNRDLWGGFVDSKATGGLQSLNRHRAIDLRTYLGNAEIGGQFYELTSGYANEYAADKVLPNVVWTKQDYSIYARYDINIDESLRSLSMLRYFGSDVPNNSALAQGFNAIDEITGDTVRLINFELWQSVNSSWAFFQNFNYNPIADLFFSGGFEYQQKNLQKAYEIYAGPYMYPDSVFADEYYFPHPPDPAYKYDNRVVTEEKGIFVNGKYSLTENHIFHAGVRYDHQSEYGGSTTLRAGYIYNRLDFVFKLLYGEAYQAPSPRVLYGSWSGLGSEPELKPEEGSTFETGITYSSGKLRQSINAYHAIYTNTILNFNIGGANIGERNIFGIDYQLNYFLNLFSNFDIDLHAYYSYTHTNGDEVYIEKEDEYQEGPIGDIAPHKLYFGLTAAWKEKLFFTILGRFVSDRETVSTNPVGIVDAYSIIDMNMRITDFPAHGLSLSLKLKNIFDTHYFHPGIRTADAGNEPGYYSENGVWHGSSGWLSSLLPQPGRRIIMSLEYAFK